VSNLLVEGFATYGTGANSTAMRQAFLAGAWAEIRPLASLVLGALPWDNSNKDAWLSGGNSLFGEGPYYVARRVLPAELSKARFSLHVAVPSLPVGNTRAGVMRFMDGANSTIATLMIGSTGTLILDYVAGTLVTSGPVIVAEKDHHLELEIDVTNKTFKAYVDAAEVLNGSSIAFSNTNDVAQFGMPMWDSTENAVYISNLIARDEDGDYNNSFPIGDRRVATLFVNGDDDDHDGWTPQYLRKFDVGILDLTSASAAVAAEITTDTDIGANEFTFEGEFRFQKLPTGATKAVMFGKWDGDNNKRSYELYLGGPDLDNGLLVFRTSTDGTDSTTVDKVKWQWRPDLGHWYHVAMCRYDGDLMLFIDGVQQGVSVADADTYYAGTTRAAIGAEMSGSDVEPNTAFDGWVDEFRFSVGGSRYTANFTPPTEKFPRGTDDPQWGEVKWLSSWDTATVVDDGPVTLALTALHGAVAITPNDGLHAYETINSATPDDDTFLEAALIPAFSIFTMTDLPSADETVTVGTSDGSTAAVYKFVSALAAAFDVLIGSTIAETAENLVAAINKGDGEGTVYGTGTTANVDVSAEQLPSNQVEVTVLVAGADGNDIATTETCTNGAWTSTTLAGGLDIPGNSQFTLSRLPSNTTTVDSITLVGRQWKTDSGSGNTKLSFVGADGGVASGESKVLGVTPNLTFDTIEADPDTAAGLTATSILLGKLKIERAT
jgi:hypothetical protein